MKKILISLSIIGVVAAVAIGITVALFSDTETSTGNIFVAGSLDLKVDHLAQTYNGADCKTCSVTVVSDTSNQVTGKSSSGLDPGPFPHPAVLVSVINPAWTANIPGAQWVWWTDPTPLAEYGIDTIYTFEKTFVWYGPITGATLQLSIGADNSYEIYLNGNYVAGDNTEQNYNAAGQDTITGAPISNQIVQGVNTLKFVVKNWLRPEGQQWANPGGLLYKLEINSNCEGDYFKIHCRLWGEKDLSQGDTFWNFTDVKPGDHGTNLISLHVDSNDAWACLFADKTGVDDEAISNDLNVVVWEDDGDGTHEVGEAILYNGLLIDTDIPVAVPDGSPIASGITEYVGLAWCFGEQTADTNTAEITCDGAPVGDEAQGDTLTAILTAYAEQWRNNPEFDCASVQLP